MKRDELRAIGLTDEQIDKVMADYGSAINKANAKADIYKADAEKVKELQEQIEAMNNKDLSEMEQLKNALEKLTNENKAKDSELASMRMRNQFAEKGIIGEKADKLLESLSNGAFDVETLAEIISDNKKSAIAEFEKQSLNNTLQPKGSAGGETPKTETDKVVEMLSQSHSDTKSSDIVNAYL